MSMPHFFCSPSLQKYVARKARKFEMQGNRLTLPGLELAYLFHGIDHSPRSVIVGKMLPEISAVLADLDNYKDKSEKEKQTSYGGGKGGYWDDYCLAMFLMGVCMRYVAYPVSFSCRQVGVVCLKTKQDPDAELDPNEVVKFSKAEAEKTAEASLKAVFEHGSKIDLDHHLVYHARRSPHYNLESTSPPDLHPDYELGHLFACQGGIDAARHEFELVLSGKPLEVNASGRKSKYSLEVCTFLKLLITRLLQFVKRMLSICGHMQRLKLCNTDDSDWDVSITPPHRDNDCYHQSCRVNTEILIPYVGIESALICFGLFLASNAAC